MQYESGDMDGDSALELFSHLIKTGMAWTLQGSYGRTAKVLIEQGFLSQDGELLKTMEG